MDDDITKSNPAAVERAAAKPPAATRAITQSGKSAISGFANTIMSRSIYSSFELADGRLEIFLSPFRPLISKKLGYNHILKIAENLLGIPYRWGGKTSMGFDCSGLVQSVLKICGLIIPRDSKAQRLYLKNEQIDLFDAEPGDLHFFGAKNKVTHVGFSTKAAGILHSQGSVKIETIDSSNINHNKNLLDIYLSTHSIKRKFN